MARHSPYTTENIHGKRGHSEPPRTWPATVLIQQRTNTVRGGTHGRPHSLYSREHIYRGEGPLLIQQRTYIGERDHSGPPRTWPPTLLIQQRTYIGERDHSGPLRTWPATLLIQQRMYIGRGTTQGCHGHGPPHSLYSREHTQ